MTPEVQDDRHLLEDILRARPDSMNSLEDQSTILLPLDVRPSYDLPWQRCYALKWSDLLLLHRFRVLLDTGQNEINQRSRVDFDQFIIFACEQVNEHLIDLLIVSGRTSWLMTAEHGR